MIRSGSVATGSPHVSSVRARAVATVFAVSVGLLAVFGPAGDAIAAAPVVAAVPVVAAAPTPTAPSPPSPTIDSPPAGTFVGNGTTSVAGTRAAGQEVQLLSPIGGDPLCVVAADATTTWSCPRVSLPNGPSVVLRVVATGNASLANEIRVAVLAAPSVTGGQTGGAASNGTVRGTAYSNASVIVSLASGERCTSTADTSGAWSCTFPPPLANGPVAVTASQQTTYSAPSTSNDSAPLTLLFDLEPPAPPVLASPVDGVRLDPGGAEYSGTGETGATVTVFAGPNSVCTAPVAAGLWTCSGGSVAAGSYRVIAVQQDPAGNVSQGSPAITVLYARAGAPPPAGPSAVPAVPAEPAAPGAPGAPGASAAGPVTHDGTAPPPTASPAPSPTASALPPPPAARAAPPAPRVGGWGDPTRFATAVAQPAATFSWLQAALFALAALLLLALPARLLGGTIARARNGRPAWFAASLAGRNRAKAEFETAPAVSPNRWFLAGAACVAGATLIMLSGPVTSQPAYLRLLLAVMVALVVVNATATLLPLWWSRRVLRAPASLTFLPRYLVLVAVAALASRAFGVHPALVFGLLGSVAVPVGAHPTTRGLLAAVRAASLIALAGAGWLLLAVLPVANGFLGSLGAEVVNSVVLAAIGSAALVLVPVGRTSGRSILAWSPPVWAGLGVLAFTILFAVLSPTLRMWHGSGTLPLFWVASGGFAALSVGAWAWQRFVSPAVR